MATRLPAPDAHADLQAASELLRVLAAPVRLGIVRELSGASRRVGELVDTLGVSQPLVSQHLRLLRTAGIVTAHRRSREVVYALADEHIAHIVLDAIKHANEPASVRD